MKLASSAALVAASFVLVPLAHAQAVYGMVTAHNLGSLTYNTVGNGTSPTVVTRTDGSFSPIGGTFGAYYDFKSFGRIRLGADVRGSITSSTHGADPTSTGSGGRVDTAMGGLRASFPAHYKILAPYAQASFGLARVDSGVTPAPNLSSTNPFQQARIGLQNGFAYQGLVGLDIHTLPYLDLRLFEFGLGGVSGVQGQPGSHLLQSVSVGLVLHLPY